MNLNGLVNKFSLGTFCQNHTFCSFFAYVIGTYWSFVRLNIENIWDSKTTSIFSRSRDGVISAKRCVGDEVGSDLGNF